MHDFAAILLQFYHKLSQIFQGWGDRNPPPPPDEQQPSKRHQELTATIQKPLGTDNYYLEATRN